MDNRVLGRTGVKISPIGPGSDDFGDGVPPIVAAKIINRALDAGITPAQLGVLWCKDQPGVTAALIGTRKVEHLDDLVKVLEMTLDDSLREACDKLVPPGSAVCDFHNTAGWMKMKLI